MIESMMMPAAEAFGAGMPPTTVAATSTKKSAKMPFSIDALISSPDRSARSPLAYSSLDLRVRAHSDSARRPTPSPPPPQLQPPPPPPVLEQCRSPEVPAASDAATPSSDLLQQRLAQERSMLERLYQRDSGGYSFPGSVVPSSSCSRLSGAFTSLSAPLPAAVAGLSPSSSLSLSLPFTPPVYSGSPLPHLADYSSKLAHLRSDFAPIQQLPHSLPAVSAAAGMMLNKHPAHTAAVAAAAAAAAAAEMPLYPWLMSRHGRVFPGRFAPGPHLPEFLFQPFRKPKRIRTAFSPSQLLKLEHAFEKNHYVVGQERKQLAQSLNLSETQVKVWFQNRRTKHKRSATDEEGGTACTERDDGDTGDDVFKSDSDEDVGSPEGIDIMA